MVGVGDVFGKGFFSSKSCFPLLGRESNQSFGEREAVNHKIRRVLHYLLLFVGDRGI